MLRYTFGQGSVADQIETAVSQVLDKGYRTPDIYTEGTEKVSTEAMGQAVVEALSV